MPVSADSKKDDEVAVPVCVQEHERYYPTPPHPTPAVTDDERAVPVAVPVCVQEHERYCPTPPHPPSGSYLACGGTQNQSLVAVRTFQNLTAASDWFWIVLEESYCRKWLILTAASDWNRTAASDRILLPQVTVEPTGLW